MREVKKEKYHKYGKNKTLFISLIIKRLNT